MMSNNDNSRIYECQIGRASFDVCIHTTHAYVYNTCMCICESKQSKLSESMVQQTNT